jgi:maleate isomerase
VQEADFYRRVPGNVTVHSARMRLVTATEADGLDVPIAVGMGITDSLAITEVTPEEIHDLAVTRIRETPVEALFTACCTFRAFDAREAIQQTLGIPVVTSNQAALAAALRALRLPLPPGTARG